MATNNSVNNTVPTLTTTTTYATTFDTNVAAAKLQIAGTTITATGSNTDVGLTITPKGAGTTTLTTGGLTISAGFLKLPSSSSSGGAVQINGTNMLHAASSTTNTFCGPTSVTPSSSIGAYNTLVGYNCLAGGFDSNTASNVVVGFQGNLTSSTHALCLGTQGSGNGQQNQCYIAGIYAGSTPAGTKYLMELGATYNQVSTFNVTANGVIYGDGSTHAVGSTAAGTTGQILIGTTSAAPSWTSTTWPSTSSQGDILYSSAANTISKLAKNTTATRYLSNTGTTNNPAWAAVNLSNGVTGTLAETSLAPCNISSITTDTNAVTRTIYRTANDSTRVVVTTPSTPSDGDIFSVVGFGSAGWKIVVDNSTKYIRIGNSVSTQGTSGYIQSSNRYDCITLIYMSSYSTWAAIAQPIGTITVV